MFSPAPMMLLRAVVLDRDERTVLRGLGQLGVMHIARTKAGAETAPLDPPDRGEQRGRCARLRARIADLRRQLALAAPAPGEVPSEPLSLDAIAAALEQIERSAAELARRRVAIEERRDQAAAVVEQLASFEGVNLPFDDLDRFSFLHFAVGSLPEAQLDSLRQQVAGNVLLLPLPRRAGRSALVAVTSRTGRFALETALQHCKFQREQLGAEDAAGIDALRAAGSLERERLETELKQLDLAHLGLATSAGARLAVMDRFLVSEERMLEAEESFPRTDATLLISGWVPAADLAAVTQRLRELTQGSCFVEAVPPERVPDNQVPVLLRHPRLLRPFEMLVSGYGLPGYRELEPTLFVAITYMLMFGMMFGDVGHGAVLALGGLGAMIVGRKPKLRDIGLLLLLAGGASMGFGAVYGSCFGLAAFHRHALWHDPLEGNPLHLMLAAVVLGVAIISIGIVLNVINRFRKRDWVGGFLDSFGVVGALFYWGVLGLILKFATLRVHGLVGPVLALVVALPLVAWALREPLKHALARRAGRPPHGGGYMEAAMESAVEAFEAVLSYMANTISFVRLAAYAMSHAAVLMATFVLAAEVRKISGAGGIMSVAVIVAGNLVAILLEGVIAAVQALRLEYYEFFGKFFSGDGLPFSPFRLGEEGGS